MAKEKTQKKVETHSHGTPFTSRKGLIDYILARGETAVGKEAIDDRSLAGALYDGAKEAIAA